MSMAAKIKSGMAKVSANWKTVFGFIFRYNDKMLIALFLTSIFSALFGLGITYLLCYYVNNAIAQSQKITATIVALSVAIMAIYVVDLLLGVLRNTIMRHIGTRTSERIQSEAIDFSASDDYLHFISQEQKDKHMFMVNVSGNCNSTIQNGMLSFIHSISTIIGGVVIMYSISSWWIFPMALLLIVSCLVVENNNNRKFMELFGNTIRDNRMMSYYSDLLTGSASACEMTLFGLSKRHHQYMEDINRDVVGKKIKTTREVARNTMFFRIVYSLVYIFFVLLILFSGKIQDVGTILLVFTVTKSIVACSANIGGSISSVYSQATAIGQFNDYLHNGTADSNRQKIEDIKEPAHIESRNREDAVIRVNHLNFQYYSNKEVLKDVSFSVYKNEKVAIVGENGAGKTTLVNVLLGLFNGNGSVLVNGVDPYIDLNMQTAQSDIVSVMQDFGHYNGISVKDNITFGEQVSDNIREKLADIMDMGEAEIEQMLKKTMGNEFNGIGLSGGQWQKIALLRTEMDHDIVILDEPTASMDPLSETKILNDFMNCDDAEKTKLIVTHRLGCTQYADRIIVLDQGAVTEEGSFSELLALKGKYYEMYTAQAELYRI